MNLIKKLVLIFLLLCFGSIAFLYYYWRQATHIPEWYATQSLSTPEPLNSNNSSELTAARIRLQEKIEESIAKSNAIAQESTLNLNSRTSSQSKGELSQRKNVEIELRDREVNDLVMTTVVQRLSDSQILPNTPRFHTTIKDGSLETGTVINLANLSKNQLHPSESATLNRAIKTFPFLEKQDVYVAISGNPKIENNQLKLDEHTKIKLGTLSLSVPELSQRLGIPQEKIEQNLKFSLQFGGLEVKELEIIDNQVLLKGWVDQSATNH